MRIGSPEVPELTRSTPESSEGVPAALRYWDDGPTIKAVRERFLPSEALRVLEALGRTSLGFAREIGTGW
jgi:hypothetical protein